jgi:hypothetical protein
MHGIHDGKATASQCYSSLLGWQGLAAAATQPADHCDGDGNDAEHRRLTRAASLQPASAESGVGHLLRLGLTNAQTMSL